ncbi:acyl-CoA desaturase, partial [Aquimarina celericrescens]|nr:acyl-CoA desaturase [Aquimarina celericrescens]
FGMMWKTKSIYQDINMQQVEVDSKFTKNIPQWKKFDVFASSRVSRLLWVAAYIAFFAFFAATWGEWALVPITFMRAPIHG